MQLLDQLLDLVVVYLPNFEDVYRKLSVPVQGSHTSRTQVRAFLALGFTIDVATLQLCSLYF